MSTTIVKAAIKVNDEIFTGFDHGECFKFARDKFPIPTQDLKQGFIDSNGNFVDRKQAMVIARESGQLTYETDKHTLISEDLHLNWLNQQAERIAELEEQLKNAIVPKFKIGQEIYTFNKYQDCVYTLYLISIHIEQYETTEFNNLVYRARRLKDGFIGGYLEEEIFATKEEAQAKLQELQGE